MVVHIGPGQKLSLIGSSTPRVTHNLGLWGYPKVPNCGPKFWPTGFMCGWYVGLEFPMTAWDIRLLTGDDLRRRFYLRRTDAPSALNVSWRLTMRYINLHSTYLLTYLLLNGHPRRAGARTPRTPRPGGGPHDPQGPHVTAGQFFYRPYSITSHTCTILFSARCKSHNDTVVTCL